MSDYIDVVEATTNALTESDSDDARRAVANALEELRSTSSPTSTTKSELSRPRLGGSPTCPSSPKEDPNDHHSRTPSFRHAARCQSDRRDRRRTRRDGFSVEVVDDLDAAREAVLARIPEGSSVMTNTSVTLQETGIADVIDSGGPYESARNKMLALDYATQLREMKEISGQPEYAVGSVHAITGDGTLVIASASGSQLAQYTWGAANVILVVGAQKLVPTLEAAHERIFEHSLPLEDARALAAYGMNSRVGKILEIHQELPGRIHVVLIRQSIGY